MRQTRTLYGLQAVPEGAGLTLGPSRRHAGVPGARGSGSQEISTKRNLRTQLEVEWGRTLRQDESNYRARAPRPTTQDSRQRDSESQRYRTTTGNGGPATQGKGAPQGKRQKRLTSGLRPTQFSIEYQPLLLIDRTSVQGTLMARSRRGEWAGEGPSSHAFKKPSSMCSRARSSLAWSTSADE